jgi:3-phosphoshikimate 1-carboxyvinyltransferase
MIAIIEPGNISGRVCASPSKSLMQRACAAALLYEGKTIIHNPGNSDDDKVALNIIQQLGAAVSTSENVIEIQGGGVGTIAENIDCGESGLAARLFIPIAALYEKELGITGKVSLLKRPMHTIFDVLPKLGVTISADNGHLPVQVRGPLKPASLFVDGSSSSQFISGLLFAFAYAATEKITIEVSDLKSKPYIDMTLQVLQHFGYKVSHHNYSLFTIEPVVKQNSDVTIEIEGDWSSAAYLLAGAAISGSVTLTGLNMNSLQADRAILKALDTLGAQVVISEEHVSVQKSEKLKPFEFDATDCPDLFPILSVLAACCKGESYIKGVHRLFYKESNRLVSIGDMLQEFGIFFSIEDDTMVVEGRGGVEHATIDSYNDHRIVMAASVAGLRAAKPVVVTGAACVSKSYPGFFRDLSALGAVCTLKEDEHE